jgi:hypothetical protein
MKIAALILQVDGNERLDHLAPEPLAAG